MYTDYTSVDPFSAALESLRLESTFISAWTLQGNWSFRGPEEKCAIFHYVLGGEIEITADGHHAVRLCEGDLALFPHGTAHTVGGGAPMNPLPLESYLPDRSKGGYSEIAIDGRGSDYKMLCAGLHYGGADTLPFYQLLPNVVILRHHELDAEPFLKTALVSICHEAKRLRDGKNIILRRGMELIYVLALRKYIESSSPSSSPVSRAIHDRKIGKALSFMYNSFDKRLGVKEIAEFVGMSRSAFSDKFKSVVGDSPARHLTRVRLHEAKTLLEMSDLNHDQIAHRVGFSSAVGLHLAFRSVYGIAPGSLRRKQAR